MANVDHAVANDHFFEELWDQDPPRSATTTLQTYIGHIRRTVALAAGDGSATAADEMIVTVGRGYMLSSKSTYIDLIEFRRLEREGCLALRAGDYEKASSSLRKALSLWRGPAFVNVDYGRLLGPLVARLEQCRLTAHEHRVYADLQLGEHHSLVSELAELTAVHPLHESLHGHLMLALYRCGRRAEALAVFQALRTRLVAELGLEPADDLTRLQHAILVGDPSLSLPGADAGRRPKPVVL